MANILMIALVLACLLPLSFFAALRTAQTWNSVLFVSDCVEEGYVELNKRKMWKLILLRVSTKDALFQALFSLFFNI